MLQKYVRYTFAIIHLILVASLFLITPQQAKAWDGDLPTCTDIPDYTSDLQSDPSYDVEKTGFVVFKRNWSGPPFNGNPGIAIDWDTTTESGNGNDVMFIGSPGNTGNILYVNVPPSMIINPDGSLSAPSYTGYGGYSDINCISAVHNAKYDSTYTGKTDYDDPVSGGTIDAPPSEPCDWWDLVCVTQKIYLSVTNGFTQIMLSLSNITSDLITPVIESIIPGEDNNTLLSDMFNNTKNALELKLGFLTYPFEWFATFFTNVQQISWTGGFSPSCIYGSQGAGIWGHCNTTFEVWQGQSVTIYWGQMEYSFPQLWNISLILIRFVFFVSLIEMLRRAYFRTVKG